MSNAELESIGERIKKLHGTVYFGIFVGGLRMAVVCKLHGNVERELRTLRRIKKALDEIDKLPYGTEDKVSRYMSLLLMD